VNRLFLIFIILISTQLTAEEIIHNGEVFTIEINETSLDCGAFSITSQERSLPFEIRESKIPRDITMGHYGRPHLLSQSIKFNSKDADETYSEITDLLPSYEKIEPQRVYIAKPIKCFSNNSVIFSFWGGGNCTTVCEAWGLVEFSKSGKVVLTIGISHKNFKEYN